MPRNIDAGGAALHLYLRVVNAGLVIGKQFCQILCEHRPVQPELIRSDRHQHRTHSEIDPSSRLQSPHAGIDEWQPSFATGPGLEIVRVKLIFRACRQNRDSCFEIPIPGSDSNF